VVKPGHATNCEFAKLIVAQMNQPLRKAQAFGPPPPEESGAPKKEISPARRGVVMNIEQLQQVLPHRYPFLMVDYVTKMEENKIEAVKNVTINESFFQGHFPGHPIMPGVLQLEAMAQVAGLLMLKRGEEGPHLAYFMAADSVKWRKPVVPGDVLVIETEIVKTRGKIVKAKGICTVDGEIVSEAEITFMLRPQSE
jgi:UDP-3-O-[3-hydroxymyristoyl] N-acetylglucosamine deacetylase / 3-hydroxyacyl-[acyl-carrier-protein] dehydratase